METMSIKESGCLAPQWWLPHSTWVCFTKKNRGLYREMSILMGKRGSKPRGFWGTPWYPIFRQTHMQSMQKNDWPCLEEQNWAVSLTTFILPKMLVIVKLPGGNSHQSANGFCRVLLKHPASRITTWDLRQRVAETCAAEPRVELKS